MDLLHHPHTDRCWPWALSGISSEFTGTQDKQPSSQVPFSCWVRMSSQHLPPHLHKAVTAATEEQDPHQNAL